MEKILKKTSLFSVVYAAVDPGDGGKDCWSKCVVDKDVATLKCFECIFANLLNIAIQAGGVIAFIMLLLGGFRYLTAGDDPKKAEAARNTMTFAILGIVILIAIWFILRFIEEFTGVKVTEFKIGD